MYIIKNALRCISRAKGRNILIGIIVLVIAVSACLGLSIRQAASDARSDALENISVTATISFDRRSQMQGMKKPQEGNSDGQKGSFDKAQFAQMMQSSSSLTLEEYQTYAAADSVKDFYYSMTVSANGSDSFAPVSTETEEDTQSSQISSMPGGMGGGRMQMAGSSSDFQLVGYSGESAMTDFISGTSSVSDGAIFTEGTKEMQCIISEELATFNELAVGDKVVLTNPDNEEETYTLSVVGIYTDTSSNESSFGGPGMSFDAANKIYMSYPALQKIVDASKKVSEDTAMSGNIDATYVFADVASYEIFEEQVYEMGLDESYTVSSEDILAYESSLTPLETLSTMATWFLLVILIIGAVILIVLNVFNVRERKYEIGVLTAMGMKKSKVALQFLTEIFSVTLIAVLLGACIGAVSSVPVTNALLQSQITSRADRAGQVERNFGRGTNAGQPADNGMAKPDSTGSFVQMIGSKSADYITEIDSAMNLTVLLQMLGLGVLLTLAAGGVSVLFVMRYEPLKILANRD